MNKKITFLAADFTSESKGIISITPQIKVDGSRTTENDARDISIQVAAWKLDGHSSITLYDKNGNEVYKVTSRGQQPFARMYLRIDANHDDSVVVLDNPQSSEGFFRVSPDLFSTGRVEMLVSGKLGPCGFSAGDGVGNNYVIDVADGCGVYKATHAFKVEAV